MADWPTVLGLMQANSLTQRMTHWDDRLTLLLGADWLTILGLMQTNSLTQWMTYGTDRLTLLLGADWLTVLGLMQTNSLTQTLLSGGWEAKSLVRWFGLHWLTVLGLTDQLIASQKHWLADSTVWWLSNTHLLNVSEQTYWLPKDLLENSLTYWMT